ncbi:MAG: hypothetical protein ABSE69_02640 [Roseiarcus sp.]
MTPSIVGRGPQDRAQSRYCQRCGGMQLLSSWAIVSIGQFPGRGTEISGGGIVFLQESRRPGADDFGPEIAE